MHAYARRLASAPEDTIRSLCNPQVVLSAYGVPDQFMPRDQVDMAVLPRHLRVLWRELQRRQSSPSKTHTGSLSLPGGIVSHRASAKHVGSRIEKHFLTPLPTGMHRVFIGALMAPQRNFPHPLSYGPSDYVYARPAPSSNVHPSHTAEHIITRDAVAGDAWMNLDDPLTDDEHEGL